MANIEAGHGPTEAERRNWLALFRQFDRENKGYIVLDELRQRVEAAGETAGLDPLQRQRLLVNADRDGSKLIDFPEFCFMMARAKRLRARHVMFRAAQFAVAKPLREETFSYVQQYNCLPPPLFMLLITLIQAGIYVYYVVTMKAGISISGPIPTHSPFIYTPYRRIELWRFLTYMFIHIGIYHMVFNALTQLALGIPLELVHKPWRIGAVYLVGVITGSLAVSMVDPNVYLAGASGGVYALIAAHVANVLVNWNEMEFAICRTVFLTILIGVDFAVAIYNRYFDPSAQDNKVSHVAHIGGFVSGLLMGIVVLRNFRKAAWERVVWWIALVGYIVLLVLCIAWNLVMTDAYPKQHTD